MPKNLASSNELPPLPSGASLDKSETSAGVDGLPPLPPGAQMSADAGAGPPSPGPVEQFSTWFDKSVKSVRDAGADAPAPPAPGGSAPPPDKTLSRFDQMKEALKAQYAPLTKWKDVANFYKDEALGAGQAVTGLGELVPGLHPYAAEGSKYLQSHVDSPLAADIGYGGAMMLGGEAAGAGKLVSAVGGKLASIIPAAAEDASILTKLLSGAAKGSVKGATSLGLGGAAAGALSPTGEPNYPKSMEQKGAASYELGTWGALLGAAIGAPASVLGVAMRAWKGAHGSDAIPAAKQALNDARAEVQGLSGAKAAQAEQTAKGYERLVEGLKSQEGEGQKLSASTDRLSQPLGTPGAPGDIPKEIGPMPVANESLTADQAANRLADEIAMQPTMDKNAFGDRVQKLTDSVYGRLLSERTTKSGLGDAIDAAGDTPKVDTTGIRAYIANARKAVANKNTESILDWIDNTIQTVMKVDGGTAQVRGLSVAKADSLRKTLNEAARTGSMKVANNTDASAAEAGHYLRDIAKMLTISAGKAEPGYAAALGRFKSMSRPLDVFERKGDLSGVAREDSLSGDYQMAKADVIGRLLTKTKKGSSAMQRLISEDPTLKDDARRYFQHQLFGESGLGQKVSPDSLQKFLTNNKDALEQTGLTAEFTQRAGSVERAFGRLSEESKANKAQVSSTKQAMGVSEKAQEAAKSAIRDFDKMNADLELKSAKPKDIERELRDLPAKGRSIANKLYGDGHIGLEDYNKLNAQFADVGNKFANLDEARNKLKQAKRLIAGFAALDLAAGTGAYLKSEFLK